MFVLDWLNDNWLDSRVIVNAVETCITKPNTTIPIVLERCRRPQPFVLMVINSAVLIFVNKKCLFNKISQIDNVILYTNFEFDRIQTTNIALLFDVGSLALLILVTEIHGAKHTTGKSDLITFFLQRRHNRIIIIRADFVVAGQINHPIHPPKILTPRKSRDDVVM